MFTLSAPITSIKPVITKDADFSYNRRIENKYLEMLDTVATRIDDILYDYDANDPYASIEVMQTLQDFSNDLYSWANDLVGGLLYSLNADDERTWKAHSSLMSKRLRWELEHVPIEPMMAQYLNENVGLIQSMPLRAAERVQQVVLKNLWTGEYRPEGLEEQIMNIGNITRNRAKLIARTEVARISTGLTKSRSEALNIPWYMWKTSHDARVRSTHAHMDKVLIRWSDPASPEELMTMKSYGHYHPGEIWNCRCNARPLLRISEISFPAKVYMNGQIRTMNQNAFIELTAGQIPMAA